MTTYNSHYLSCTDPLCGSCLPSDDSVRAMSLGEARQEYGRRGYSGHIPTRTIKDYLVENGDSYRAQVEEARVNL